MRTNDLSPLWRSTIRFDRLIKLIDDSIRRKGKQEYPPYDMVGTGQDHCQTSLAPAGFALEDIAITAAQNALTIEAEKGDHSYLYQGISARPFSRAFSVADYVRVKDATFENGLLKIDLVREMPETMKPRKIAIRTAGNHRHKIEENPDRQER